MYADDANIIITGKTIDEIQNKISSLIPKLTKWVNSNYLKLNTTKTKYMVISNTINHEFDIKINNNPIARVTEEKFLGVLINDKLTFRAHKLAIAKKVANNCGVLFRAQHVLHKTTLKTLVLYSRIWYTVQMYGAWDPRIHLNIFLFLKKGPSELCLS